MSSNVKPKDAIFEALLALSGNLLRASIQPEREVLMKALVAAISSQYVIALDLCRGDEEREKLEKAIDDTITTIIKVREEALNANKNTTETGVVGANSTGSGVH